MLASALLLVTLSLSLSALSNARAEQVVLERVTSRPLSTLPVDNSTQSFWLRSPGVSPSPTEGSEGSLTSDADVCIIGSGITGVSAAYHLAQSLGSLRVPKPINAVILEAREFCSGATGRNGGHMTDEIFRGFLRLKSLFGEQEAVSGLAIEHHTVSHILSILRENRSAAHVDLVQGGRTILLFTKEDSDNFKRDFLAARAAGVNVDHVEWLTKEEVQQAYGASYPAVRIPGNNLWPLKLVSVLYNLANDASDNFSLSLHTRTPVTGIAPASADSSRRWDLTTPRGSVSCSYVLHATNAYASHLLPFMHGPDGIVPTRGQIIATRANTSDALKKSGFLGDDEYWFPRPLQNASEHDLVILGGAREASNSEGHESYVVDDSVVNEDIGKVLREFLPSVFPGKFAKAADPEMEWTGIMGYTKLLEPFVGPVVDPRQNASASEYQGQYISAGYSGHGMPRAFACAEAAAGMIVADINGEKWEKPAWFPKHYLTTERV